jgi:Domain of unknown function (DUF5753)
VSPGEIVAMTKKRGTARIRGLADEAALLRPVGGPQVMAAQLRHVAHLATHPHIDVRVIPFERGAHTGMDGTFTVMSFAKARPVVYLEHKMSSLFLDEPSDVEPFHKAADMIAEAALDSPESVNCLARLTADYEKS